MAAMNRNHAKYERRLNFIRREMPFSTRFNIEVGIEILHTLQKCPIPWFLASLAEKPADYNVFP